MMAHRSDREPGYPAECPRHHSLRSRVGPSSRIPLGPAVEEKAAYDGRYAQAVTLASDVKILLKTVGYFRRPPPKY